MNLLVPSHRKGSSSHGSSPYKEIQRQTGIHGLIHGDIHTKMYTHTHTHPGSNKHLHRITHIHKNIHPLCWGKKRASRLCLLQRAVLHTLLLTPAYLANPLPRLREETPSFWVSCRDILHRRPHWTSGQLLSSQERSCSVGACTGFPPLPEKGPSISLSCLLIKSLCPFFPLCS